MRKNTLQLSIFFGTDFHSSLQNFRQNMVQDSDENQPTTAGATAEDQIALQDQQLKQIEEEQKSIPLVGEKLPIAVLVSEYDAETSAAFLVKATELTDVYSEIRQIRGDGNCFYRAVLTGLVEIMLKDRERLTKFIASGKDWIGRLQKLGFPEWTCTDFCEFFIDFLENISSGKTDAKAVFENLNNDSTSNYYLMFFRLITSGFLKEHADEYAPFIDEGLTVSQYCETEIEAMWKDADHIAITALIKAAETRVRIEYMDRTAAPNGGWHYDIPSEEQIVPEITLLYRPGHYDLIYKKAQQ